MTNDIYRVVISHNQSNYIGKFYLENTVFVFDSITSDDVSAIGDIPYIIMPTAGNRSANRNAGLKYWYDCMHDDDVIEFFDGDRFPLKYKKPFDEMLNTGADILLYPCENDLRYRYAKTGDVLKMGGPGNPFFSCGFAIRKHTIDEIIKFNGGVFFREEFSGWGGEDQYMGTVAHHLKLKCVLSSNIVLNGDVGGDEGVHNEYISMMSTYVKLVFQNGLQDAFLDGVGLIPIQKVS